MQPGCFHQISGKTGNGVELGFSFGAKVGTKATFLHPHYMPLCAEACVLPIGAPAERYQERLPKRRDIWKGS